MREILFRGRLTDKSRWVYGCLLNNIYGSVPVIMTQQSVNDAFSLEFEYDHVEEKTVGQFTGMTDKNGKKIFEGDIVDCWSEGVNAKGTVQQRRDGLWIIYPAWQKTIMWGLRPDEYSKTTVEVIGNIYDNPELLEGKINGQIRID